MIIRINLVNIHHPTQLQNFFLEMRTFKTYSLSNFQIYIQYSVVNCGHNALRYIPMTCNWKFIPFDHLHPSHSPTPASGNHQFFLCKYEFSF